MTSKGPNFLILGAMKAGTTAFHEILKKHPEIYMSDVKEPRHFALKKDFTQYNGPKDPAANFQFREIEKYLELFSDVENEKAIGESSTLYLYHPDAAQNIYDYNPDMKLIAILREPVDRAYSNYIYARRDARESAGTFFEAIDLEHERQEKNWGPLWHYLSKGHYLEQLSRYYDLFPKKNILVIDYSEYRKNPDAVFKKAFAFLNVDSNFSIKSSSRHNVSGVPRNAAINTAINSTFLKKAVKVVLPASFRSKARTIVNNFNIKKAAKLRDEDRKKLFDKYYKEEIGGLEKLTGLDLRHWKLNK